ncbi:MAG: DUF2252 family protein [Bdellovibrionales bacterium]|nr:DUF2252 family protein [Bdellovibrionales bacterium]
MRITILLILLQTMLVGGPSAFAASEACRGKRLWVSTEGSLMMALRSNACHFWLWSAQHAGQLLSPQTLSFHGLVAGDAHHENFSHVLVGDERVYVLNDVDDSGEGALFLDFLKFLGVSRSVAQSEKVLSSEQMLAAYTRGVRGESWPGEIPSLLKADAAVSAEDLAVDYAAKIKKSTTDGKFDRKDGLLVWDDMRPADQRRFQRFEGRYFRAHLPAGYEVMDRALFVKDGGGSGGAPRYWYYLKKSANEREIIEFKALTEPAVALMFPQTLSAIQRVRAVADAYCEKGIAKNFGPVGDADQAFWMRPRLPSYIDFNAKLFSENPKAFAELSHYIAYKLGHWHGLQQRNADYGKYLSEHHKELAQNSAKFIAAYLSVARSQQRH